MLLQFVWGIKSETWYHNTFCKVKDLESDLILSFGNVYYYILKYFLPQYAKTTEHWQIASYDMINDGYHCLSKVFQMRPEEFFERLNNPSNDSWKGSYAKFGRPLQKIRKNFRLL